MVHRDDTSNIRYVFVSQDPAVFYVKSMAERGLDLREGKAITQCFVHACKGVEWNAGGDQCPGAGSQGKLTERDVITYAANILGIEHFNPESGLVYWTHVMKCPPKYDNKEFKRDWVDSDEYCATHLESELSSIKSANYCVISIGKKSMLACADILGLSLGEKARNLKKKRVMIDGKSIEDWKSITYWHKYQIMTGDNLGVSDKFKDKKITFFAFTHSSGENARGSKLVQGINNNPGIIKRLYPLD